MAFGSLERALRVEYGICEELFAHGTFVYFKPNSQEGKSLVEIGLAKSSLVVADLDLSGEDIGYKMRSFTPWSLLTIKCGNKSKKLTVVREYRSTQVYQLCSSEEEDEIWDQFKQGIRFVVDLNAFEGVYNIEPIEILDLKDVISATTQEVSFGTKRCDNVGNVVQYFVSECGDKANVAGIEQQITEHQDKKILPNDNKTSGDRNAILLDSSHSASGPTEHGKLRHRSPNAPIPYLVLSQSPKNSKRSPSKYESATTRVDTTRPLTASASMTNTLAEYEDLIAVASVSTAMARAGAIQRPQINYSESSVTEPDLTFSETNSAVRITQSNDFVWASGSTTAACTGARSPTSESCESISDSTSTERFPGSSPSESKSSLMSSSKSNLTILESTYSTKGEVSKYTLKIAESKSTIKIAESKSSTIGSASKSTPKIAKSKSALKIPESISALKFPDSKSALKFPESKSALKFRESTPTPKIPESKSVLKIPESKTTLKFPESQSALKFPESKSALKFSESKSSPKIAESKSIHTIADSKSEVRIPESKSSFTLLAEMSVSDSTSSLKIPEPNESKSSITFPEPNESKSSIKVQEQNKSKSSIKVPEPKESKTSIKVPERNESKSSIIITELETTEPTPRLQASGFDSSESKPHTKQPVSSVKISISNPIESKSKLWIGVSSPAVSKSPTGEEADSIIGIYHLNSSSIRIAVPKSSAGLPESRISLGSSFSKLTLSPTASFRKTASKSSTPPSIVLSSSDASSSIGIKPTESRSSVGIKPTECRSYVGIKPTESRSSVGIKPSESRSSVGIMPTESRSSVGIMPTESRSSVGIMPTESRSSVRIMPTASRVSFGISPTASRSSVGINPTESRSSVGIKPTASRVSFGISPTQSMSSFGIKPSASRSSVHSSESTTSVESGSTSPYDYLQSSSSLQLRSHANGSDTDSVASEHDVDNPEASGFASEHDVDMPRATEVASKHDVDTPWAHEVASKHDVDTPWASGVASEHDVTNHTKKYETDVARNDEDQLAPGGIEIAKLGRFHFKRYNKSEKGVPWQSDSATKLYSLTSAATPESDILYAKANVTKNKKGKATSGRNRPVTSSESGSKSDLAATVTRSRASDLPVRRSSSIANTAAKFDNDNTMPVGPYMPIIPNTVLDQQRSIGATANTVPDQQISIGATANTVPDQYRAIGATARKQTKTVSFADDLPTEESDSEMEAELWNNIQANVPKQRVKKGRKRKWLKRFFTLGFAK